MTNKDVGKKFTAKHNQSWKHFEGEGVSAPISGTSLTPLKDLLKVHQAKKFLKDVEQFDNFLSLFIQAWREYKEKYDSSEIWVRDKFNEPKRTYSFEDFMNYLEERDDEEFAEYTKKDFYSGLDIMSGEEPIGRRIENFNKHEQNPKDVLESEDV